MEPGIETLAPEIREKPKKAKKTKSESVKAGNGSSKHKEAKPDKELELK